jgi:hypothetical protein
MSLIKDIRLARDSERRLRSQGWGPEWRYPVERSGGDSLVLSFRVPVDWKAIDVLKMPSEAAASGSLAQAMALLAREVDATGVIGVVGIGRVVEREGQPDLNLFATISFAFAEVAGPLPESSADTEVEAIEFEHQEWSYRGVRVRRTHPVKAAPDQLGASFLTIQYLVRTDYGALAITFATPQAAFGQLIPLLDKIAGACVLRPAGTR